MKTKKYTKEKINCDDCRFNGDCAWQEEALKRNNPEELYDMYLDCDAYEAGSGGQ
jgi:hypothetical protein